MSNLYKLMPRNHYLVRPFGIVNISVRNSELGFGLSWYGGLQNYVAHLGDAAVVKRTRSIEEVPLNCGGALQFRFPAFILKAFKVKITILKSFKPSVLVGPVDSKLLTGNFYFRS